MMKKTLAIFVGGGILGTIVGAGAMLVAFPFVFPPPEVNETVSASDAVLIGKTRFREDSRGQDGGHWGRGDIKFYRTTDGSVLAELQADFEVGPGPNFWIYLNGNDNIEDEADFTADEARLKVHKIKSFRGSQVYVFDAADFANARALTIWCESFNQYIASANIPVQI